MAVDLAIDTMRSIVIYGAGSGGRKAAKILMDLHYHIIGFVDSNPEKWGGMIYGIEIFSPEWLTDKNCSIVIASVKEEEIRISLENKNLAHFIVEKETYILKFLDEHLDEFRKLLGEQDDSEYRLQFIISSETGLGRWGVEQYTRTVAQIYQEHHIPVTIFTKICNDAKKEKEKRSIVEFDFDAKSYQENLIDTIKEIAKRRPCFIQENWQSFTLFASILAKKLFPGQITILSMIHNEFQRFQRIAELAGDEIDYVSAVSKDIVERLKQSGKIELDKILYKESPIEILPQTERYYEAERENPLRIAYGGRITKEQKRTHLLIPFMEKLIEKKVNFRLDMVGNGDYKEEFLNEVTNRKLDEHFCYLGLLENDKMLAFWQEHDIYINVSAYEGASLAMLEAMSTGCIPVVTEVSGTAEYIENGQNGFVCGVNCVDKMAEKIQRLDDKRELLEKIGENARKKIADKCSREDFFRYWMENIAVLKKDNVS